MAGLLCILTSCGDPRNKPSSVVIDTPATGTQVTGALAISGSYHVPDPDPLSFGGVTVTLVRYSDGKAWDGTNWGGAGTTTLATTPNTTNKTWVCSATMPSDANLADGYYHITATISSNGDHWDSHCIFSVGLTAPPVTSTLHSWGWNGNSHTLLGAGPGLPSDNNHPVSVFSRGHLDGKNVVAIATGTGHTLALTTEGKVYAWGEGDFGRNGTGSSPSSFEPVPVIMTGALSGKIVTAIAASTTHSLAVTSDGMVFAWGSGEYGQLGNGQSGGLYGVTQPVAVVMTGALAGKKVRSVAAGNEFSLALTTDGKLFAWGMNFYGQLGIGTDGSGTSSAVPVAVQGLDAEFVATIAAGDHHWLCTTSTESSPGKVFGCGKNPDGELGDGTTTNRSLPVQIGTTSVMAGKIIQSVATGHSHSLALDSVGRVYAWGSGAFGKLGTGDTTNALSPVQLAGPLASKVVTQVRAGTSFSLVGTADNKVFAFGSNSSGQLAGASAIGTDVLVPTEADFSTVLAGGKEVQQLACGSGFAVLLASPPPLPAPEIEVEAQGLEIADGGSLSCGTFGVGSSNPVWITIRNRGGSNLADLTGISVNLTDTHFHASISQPALAPNGETGFYVFFDPKATGALSSTLQIFSNDPDESPFDITLTGTAYPVAQVDLPFDPQVDGGIDAISVQGDGKVIVGGSFLNVGPAPRNRCARLDPTTGAADSFNPDVGNFISCSLVLPDGKVMIGGFFTSVGPVGRNKLARLNADGTLDTTYNAKLGGSFGVTGMALQSDGKLIVVGNISSVAGAGVTFIARLNPDGTRDDTFAPTLNAPPRGVAVRGDGQVLIWGQFTIVNGYAYSRIALLNGADGTTDTSFLNPLIVISGSQIDTAAIQRDTKVLVGGNVQSVKGTTIHGMCRLNPDGSLDESFDPNVDGQVNSIALQADGSMIIGGQFTHVGGQPRNLIAKIAANGSLDAYFNPGSDGSSMGAVMLQADGKVLCTPATTIAGEPRSNLARLSNGVATQSLSMKNNGTTIEWLRDGTSPEANLVTFDVSTNGGTTWTPVGAASRVTFPARGWTLTDGGLPPSGHIRARAYAQGARYNGSSSIMETISAYGTPPDIVVTEGTINYNSGNTRLLGVVATGSASSVIQLTIQNAGGSPLTGLSGASIEDNNLFDTKDHRSMFQLVKPADPTLAPGGTANISVTYRPKTTGRHTAILRIPSNDPDENPFDIILSGQGSLPITTWKQIHHGQTENTGDAADDATPAADGMTNLEKYARNLDPNTPATRQDTLSFPNHTPPSSGEGEFASDGPTGSVMHYTYSRNKLALADVLFQVEWSDTLAPNDWHTTDVTEEIITDDGQQQEVKASIPVGSSGRRFVRLRMTRL